MRRIALSLLGGVWVVMLVGCGAGATGPGEDSVGPVTPDVFTVSPIDLADITEIISIGNLAPPDHTLPTEHAYFFFEKDYSPGAPLPRLPVRAPGSGTITRVMVMGPNSYRLDIRVNSWLSYYLILLDTDTTRYRTGRAVTAGEQLGVTMGHANTLDMGVINQRIRRTGFARSARYGPETAHIDSPFRYFAEPMRSEIYRRVNREGSDKDGTIEVDVPGTLAGNWFRDDVPLGLTGRDAWSRAIVFAPDVRHPERPRISIGEGFPINGLYGVQPGSVAFREVRASSGAVGFRLDAMDNSSDPWRGVLRVQLAGTDTLYAEFFPGSTNLAQPMTPNRVRYLR